MEGSYSSSVQMARRSGKKLIGATLPPLPASHRVGCGAECRRLVARTEGEEMRAARLQELQEMAAKLLATARELPPGQEYHNALREIGRFRVQIAALQGADLRRAQLGLKAKGK